MSLDLLAMACVVVEEEASQPKKKTKVSIDKNQIVDETTSKTRAACHRCGNMRKQVRACPSLGCPHIFCLNCIDKIEQEYPHIKNLLQTSGCAFCLGLCCCAHKSESCKKKIHCYRKCPVSKILSMNATQIRELLIKRRFSSRQIIEIRQRRFSSTNDKDQTYEQSSKETQKKLDKEFESIIKDLQPSSSFLYVQNNQENLLNFLNKDHNAVTNRNKFDDLSISTKPVPDTNKTDENYPFCSSNNSNSTDSEESLSMSVYTPPAEISPKVATNLSPQTGSISHSSRKKYKTPSPNSVTVASRGTQTIYSQRQIPITTTFSPSKILLTLNTHSSAPSTGHHSNSNYHEHKQPPQQQQQRQRQQIKEEVKGNNSADEEIFGGSVAGSSVVGRRL